MPPEKKMLQMQALRNTHLRFGGEELVAPVTLVRFVHDMIHFTMFPQLPWRQKLARTVGTPKAAVRAAMELESMCIEPMFAAQIAYWHTFKANPSEKR